MLNRILFPAESTEPTFASLSYPELCNGCGMWVHECLAFALESVKEDEETAKSITRTKEAGERPKSCGGMVSCRRSIALNTGHPIKRSIYLPVHADW